MEFSLDRYYKFNRQLLSVIGLWPYQSAINAWIQRVSIISFMLWSIIGQIVKIYTSELGVHFILDCLAVNIPTIGILLQFLDRIFNSDKHRSLLNHMKIDWERPKSYDEIKIMQRYSMSAKKMTKLFTFYVLVGSNAYILLISFPQILDVFLPLNESRSREQPFNIEFFIFNEKEHFYLIRFIMCLLILLSFEIILANATLFVVYMEHASGMFTTLGQRAEQLFSERSSKAGRFIRGTEKDYRNIVLFVEDHRSVIQFVDNIQSSYSDTLLGEYLVFMVLIGLTLVQIFSGLSDRLFRAIAFLGGQLFYLLMLGWMGQHIIDTSARLYMKIYCGNWHNMSIWKQKIMLLVMIKCTRTVSITSYNLYTLSLETFSSIIQSGISICMLLTNI